MAKQKINRYLDTCPCIVYYEVEADEFINPKTINKCMLHAEFDDGSQHFNTIVADDLHRAHVLQKILTLLPDELRIEQDESYAFVQVPACTYNDEYALVITIDGLTTEQKSDIAAAVNDDDAIKEFGNHLVILG